MNGHRGGGTRVDLPVSACSPQQRKVCDEARAAAAWLWIQSELAGALERFSKDLLAIHAEGLSAVTALDISRCSDSSGLPSNGGPPGSGAGGGARDALNSLLLLCSETAAEADRYSSSLRVGVVKPLDDALEPLARAADPTGSLNAANSQGPAALGGDGDVQKAVRRLQLAEEELTKAEASLHELRSLFGSDMNSSLEQKATQRISRASRLKAAAQEALQQAVAAHAARQPQGSSLSAAQVLPSAGLRGSARLLVAGNGAGWAEAGGVRADDHHRRVSSAMLQSMRAAGKAALASQQRSTGYVLHYVKDLQLFAAAEVATAGASGGFTGENEEEILPTGASEDLMDRLYRPTNGASAGLQQQTSEATMRNLLRHQEKQLQEMLTERDELHRQTDRQQKEIEKQQKVIDELKRQRRDESPADTSTPRETRTRLRKQVTIRLSDIDEDSTPWRQQQQQNRYQGGELGELHGRADGGKDNAADTALQLSAINAGSDDRTLMEVTDGSPPAAGRLGLGRPIEMAWVDVQLRYEAFLLTLRSLPLSNVEPRNTEAQQQPRQQYQRKRSSGERSGLSTSRATVTCSEKGMGDLQWMDPTWPASLTQAIEYTADAALPSFLVRCCRLVASGASPSSQAKRPPRAGRPSRMSVHEVQGRILWNKRQQQQQQQEDASGRPPGPLDWGESDMQVLAYELLLLVVYHYSQYAAAAALLVDDEEALQSSTAWLPESPRDNLQDQQEQKAQHATAATPSRQVRRPRKSLARALSFKRHAQEEEQEALHEEQQVPEASVEKGPAEDTAAHQQSHYGPSTTPSRQQQKPRKSLARAMSFKLGVFHGDEGEMQLQQMVEVSADNAPGGNNASMANPRPDLLGPCHPFSLPLEEWQQRIAGEGPSNGPPSSVMPARRRLKAARHWMSPSPLLQQSNEEVLLQLLQLARVCFELPSASSNKLLGLLTPLADSGLNSGGSIPTFLHPCDLRFRVCRLMEAWRVALCPAATTSKAPPRKPQQQQQQQQQRNVRFLHGSAAAAMGRFDATQGVRGAIRRRAGNQIPGGEKKGLSEAANAVNTQANNPSNTAQGQPQQQQLAGDLGPPILLETPQEKRRTKRLSATAVPQKPTAPPDEPQKREDPVFQSFIQRQLQLLHAAALTRCARLLKFLLPQGKAAAAASATAAEPPGSAPEGPLASSLAWRPVQLQQLYAREKSRSDEEAFLFFLRSLLLCQDETGDPKTAPQAPAFLLYSKEDTAAAIAAAAQLQLLPLRLLCCFYHIFAYIFAMQQLQKQQLWGEDEASVRIEEVSIHVTDYSGAPAGTGEAEAPLTWEVRTEQRERGGLQLLQLLQHCMSQAASLDSALRCSLAARSKNNPTLKRLAASSSFSRDAGTPSQQRLRRQQSLKPVANLLEVPDAPSECGGEITDTSDGGFISNSDAEGVERKGGPSSVKQNLRSALRRPTLKALRRRTLRTLETGASAARAAAAASMLSGDEHHSICLPREVQLNAYWCMDIPLLLSLLLLLGRCCTDANAVNGLQLDAPSLVQGLLLVAHAAQVGTDPTCPVVDEGAGSSSPSSSMLLRQAARAGSGFPGISLESVALLVASCVWAAGSPRTASSSQGQQQQPGVRMSGAGDSSEPPLQAQGSLQSTAFTSTNRSDPRAAAHLQQQLLLQQLVAAVPSSVQPMGAEVVSSALEVLTNFSDFLKKPSADVDAATDEVGWLLGAPQCGGDSPPEGTAEGAPAAAGSTAARAAVMADPSGVSKARFLSTGAAGGPIALPSSGSRAGPLDGQAISITALLPKHEQRKNGGTLGANEDVNAGVSLDPVDLLLRVRGERLALSLPASLLQQQEDAGQEDRGASEEATATFSGFMTSRLWLGADWWVIRRDGGGGAQQGVLRSSRWASFCYGLSALLPSRVELQQQEIASVQLLCCNFLLRLQQQLQDYRRHFEPQVLPLALCVWHSVVKRLLLVMPRGQHKSGEDSRCDEAEHRNAWPAVPEGWDHRVLSALRSKMASELTDGDDPQQDEAGLVEATSSMQEESWVWGLAGVLRGPTPLHDMLRCFIYRSFSAAAGRLLGPHVSKLMRTSEEREPNRDTSSVDELSETAETPVDTGAQAEAEEDEVLCALANGIEALRRHVQSELLLYSEVFAPLLPLQGEHSLLVLAAAQTVLLSIVPLVSRCADRAAEDPERRGLPARGGQAVLRALAAFERLTYELCLGGVLCVSPPLDTQQQHRGLVSALAPRFFASFSLHLSGLTDLLSQAFLKDVFAPANPPHALYSEKAIDGWCCVYGAVEAALDSFLPLRWLLPRLLQFLSELIAALCRSLTDPCMSQSEGPGSWGGRPLLPLLALRQLQRTCFAGLLEAKGQKAAILESPLVEHFLTLQRIALEKSTKQGRKSKGWRGGMTQLVAGWEEEDKGAHGVSRAPSAFLSGVEDDNSGDSSDQYEGPSLQAPRGRTAHRHATEDDKSRSRSVFQRFFGPSGTRESSLQRGGRGEAEGTSSSGGARGGSRHIVVGMERLSAPVSHLLAAVDTLTEWEEAREKATLTGGQRPTSGLQRWLVRLHIVSLYLQRLPGLRTKLFQQAETRIVSRCPRDVEVVQHLRQLQRGEGGKGGTGATLMNGNDALQLRQEELAEATATIDDAIDSLIQKLQEAAKEICSLAAIHLVYYELQNDIFGNLYAGEEGFSGMTLSRLLLAFPNTVEAFFCSAPMEWQDEIASAVFLCLIEAWCLLLAEWGYGGHCFEDKELEVLEADLDSLRQYAADNEISFEDNADIFDRVNDFLVMLDADGDRLAAANHAAQQDSPRPAIPVDNHEKARKSTPAHGRAGQTSGSIFAPTESAPESGTPSTRRSRHRGREGSEGSDKGSGRRQHSKSKGWGGVGRWVRGVYGSTPSHRASSQGSRRAARNHQDDTGASMDSRASPRRSLRFAV